MARQYTFSEDSARRIAKTVRGWEREPRADGEEAPLRSEHRGTPVAEFEVQDSSWTLDGKLYKANCKFVSLRTTVNSTESETCRVASTNMPAVDVYDLTAPLSTSSSKSIGPPLINQDERLWAAWRGKWQLMCPPSRYDRCEALIASTSGMATGNSYVDVDNITPICGVRPTTSTTGTVSAYNRHGWDADYEARCRIEYNYSAKRWEMYQVTCPS